jgi:hypothetical protein
MGQMNLYNYFNKNYRQKVLNKEIKPRQPQFYIAFCENFFCKMRYKY